MNLPIKKLILAGIFLEMIILAAAYLLHPSIEDTFRYAARYSGRLSFFVFIYTFYLFASSHPKPFKDNLSLRNFISLFAVLHLIHLGFLTLSVYLNAIPLEVPKLIGGALAYLMIIVAPFTLHKHKLRIHLVYFYYVSIVMAMTFVARIKGDLEGAAPYWFHYVGLGAMILCSIAFGIWLRHSHQQLG